MTQPCFVASTWPLILLFLLSVSIVALAELVGDPTAAGGDATAEGAGTDAERPAGSELTPLGGAGPTSVAPAEEAGGSPDEPTDEPTDEPVPELPSRAFAVVLAVGAAVLVSLLRRRSRRWLLPPPLLVPRARWGLEQFAYGLALSMAFAVVGVQVAFAFSREDVLAASLVMMAAQCASCAAVVALVLTRPSFFPVCREPDSSNRALTSAPLERAITGRRLLRTPLLMSARLASLGVALRSPAGNLLRGAVAGAAATPLAVGAAWVGVLVCELVNVVPPEHPVVTGLRSAGAGEIAALACLVCVAAPVVEEVLFRGFLYSTLRERLGWLAAAGASSLAFGAVHPGLPNKAATFVLGLALCAVYERGGTLVAPVIAHATFNAIQVALVLLARAG